MNPEFREIDLLDKAIRNFQEITGIHVYIEQKHLRTNDNQIDALATIIANEITEKFFIEVKASLTKATLGTAIAQFNRLKTEPMLLRRNPLLVTEYVNPNMADHLKEREIQFLDTAGNAYINHPPIYIFIKGNKPPEQKKRTYRAFKPTGLKVIFAFLCNPDLINAPYRDIEKAAGVALGTIGWVIRELKEKGFLVELEKRKRRLLNKEKLLETWVTDYAEKLRPKLLLGTYKATNEDWINTVNLKTFEAYWGGEVAAEKITRYLKPEITTIYLKGKVTDFLQTHKLAKNPQGDIELREMFWDFDYKWKQQNLVPPLLVYADLLATGLDRNIETAKMLFEDELAEHFRKG